MWLHHARAQPDTSTSLRREVVCGYASRDEAKADGILPALSRRRAATRPTRRRSKTLASTRSSSPCRRAFISSSRCGRSRPASTSWSRSRRSCGWTTTGRCVEARNRADRVVLVGENDHYKPLAVSPPPAAGRGRDRRHGVRALHDDRQEAQDRRRLAQRRGDGRRRRVLRRGHSLAPPRRAASGPRIVDDSRLSAVGVARRPATRASKSMMVAFRYDNDAVGCAVLLARDSVAPAGTAAVEAVRPRRHHHVRIQRRCSSWCEARVCRGCCFPGFRDIRGYQAMYRDFVAIDPRRTARPR